MPDANITKRALAEAVKELMEEMPFEKINVGLICGRCGMNRQSFYYHFKDKYDLVNWIFDMEFIRFASSFMAEDTVQARTDLIKQICRYFYNDRSFYRKALMIKGQNSFSDHLREYLRPLLKEHLASLLKNENVDDFALEFYVDACYGAIFRWLSDKDCIPPDEFVDKLMKLVKTSIFALYERLNQDT